MTAETFSYNKLKFRFSCFSFFNIIPLSLMLSFSSYYTSSSFVCWVVFFFVKRIKSDKFSIYFFPQSRVKLNHLHYVSKLPFLLTKRNHSQILISLFIIFWIHWRKRSMGHICLGKVSACPHDFLHNQKNINWFRTLSVHTTQCTLSVDEYTSIISLKKHCSSFNCIVYNK